MTLDVCSDGKVLFSISGDFALDDIAVVSRSMLLSSSVDAGGFDNIVVGAYRSSQSYCEAYQKAEQIHKAVFGKAKYASFEAYKSAKSHRLNDSR